MIGINRSYLRIPRNFKLIIRSLSIGNYDEVSGQKEMNFLKRNQRYRWGLNSSRYNIRFLSTFQPEITLPPTRTMVSKEELQEFLDTYPVIVKDLLDASNYTDIPDVVNRLEMVIQSNIPGGKRQRGLAFLAAYKMLEKPENLTAENIRLANILGWSLEVQQTFLLMLDDIMDASETRRGHQCWYKREGVGLYAINDGILLENANYAMLRRHFSSHPNYIRILEIFLDTAMKSAVGQTFDALLSNFGQPDIDKFTMENFKILAKYKTGYAFYHNPALLAMYLAKYEDFEQYERAKNILLKFGEVYQIQNDFLDCFGNFEVTGKIGTDIKEGKCTWMIVVALEKANSTQKEIIKEHYGKNNDKSNRIILNIYEELNLRKIFAIYEEESFNNLRNEILNVSEKLPLNLFFKYVKSIYKRDV